jgi:hypothetical protein
VESPIDVALELSASLSKNGIPHAVGGAIALGFYTEPRSTIDIDVNVFVPADSLEPVLRILEGLDCSFNRDEVMRSAVERGDFRAKKGFYRIDFFVSFHRYHDKVRSRVLHVDLRGLKIPVLSAEDLLIFKVLFSRPKDWVDVTNLIAARGAGLDPGYIEHWIGELLDETDKRRQRLKNLLAR